MLYEIRIVQFFMFQVLVSAFISVVIFQDIITLNLTFTKYTHYYL